MIHVLNLGAGVQSSTLALRAVERVVQPMPDFAVFADTQQEPPSVYEWLDWLEPRLPFPVHRVTAGDLGHYATLLKRTKDGRTFSTTAVPVFTLNEDGSLGRIPHRTCTRDFKIRPIMKAIRRLAGIRRGQDVVTVTQWFGISLDEVQRMRTSREKWCVHRYPLIECRMTRAQCLSWMQERGYPEPPRSACVFCPFHSNTEWRRLQIEEPQAFADAVKFERDVQRIRAASDTFRSKPFLHRSLIPLDQIDFRSDVERGQQLLWDDECEGHCGV